MVEPDLIEYRTTGRVLVQALQEHMDFMDRYSLYLGRVAVSGRSIDTEVSPLVWRQEFEMVDRNLMAAQDRYSRVVTLLLDAFVD